MHCLVFVVGDNPEETLEKFCYENYDPKYAEEYDETDYAKKVIAKYGFEKGLAHLICNDEDIVTDEKDIDIKGIHSHCYVLLNKEGTELIRHVTVSNPHGRWDWYSIGGRWDGFLKPTADAMKHEEPGMPMKILHTLVQNIMNKGGVSGEPYVAPFPGRNHLKKKEIDFEAMVEDAALKANTLYDRFEASMTRHGFDLSKRWKPRTEYKNWFKYTNQSVLKAIRADLNDVWDHDQFLTPRDEYVAIARSFAATPKAIVIDGTWYERDDLSMSQAEWVNKVQELLAAVSDEEFITVVDCHY